MRTLFCQFLRITTNSYDTPYTSEQKPAGKEYTYLYTGNRDVKIGDWAVVHNGSEFGIVQITRIKPGIDGKVRKHVICVVTRDDFEQYKAANEGINKHREIFDQLDYILEEEKKLSKYRELAEKNPQAADLLARINIWQGPLVEAGNVVPTYTENVSTAEATDNKVA